MGATAVMLEAMGLFDDEVQEPVDPLEERQWQRVRLKRREWLRLARVAKLETASSGKYRSRQAVMEKMLVARLDDYERANPKVLELSLEQMMRDQADDDALENAITEAEDRARAKKKPAPAPTPPPVPKGRKK